MLRYVVALSCLLALAWANDCQVANIQVMQNFDRSRYAGTWYAVGKKDPEGLFLLDNIVANFTMTPERMTATALGRVLIAGNVELCAQMFATFQDTPDPAKFRMKYWGIAAALERGNDEHWVIDTDYENYAIHYSCRRVNALTGTCDDSYSFVFSRHPTGLRSEDQEIVVKKKGEICLLGKYRRVAHNGYCDLVDSL